MYKTLRNSCLILCAILLQACTHQVIVEKPVPIQQSLAPVSAQIAQPHPLDFQTRAQQFLLNKDGKVRFSPKDAQWITLFAGEADSIVTQLSGAQSQMQIDRNFINGGSATKTPDSKPAEVVSATDASTK